jgi:6-phosphofructokinase 1
VAPLIGKLVVGQSGGATAVMNASLQGVLEQTKQLGCIETVWGLLDGINGLLKEDFVDLTHLAKRQLATLGNTPGAALRSCRRKLSDLETEKAVQTLRAHNIRYFIYIGGNDSADTAHRLAMAAAASGYELHTISVPKTIDNDLPYTDHCPGYGSAARFVAYATRCSELDSMTMRSAYQVKVIELMGRNAGWLTAATALARKKNGSGAPHVICTPEVPFDKGTFLQQVDSKYGENGYVIVVTNETIRDTFQQPLGQTPMGHETDTFGHLRLSGAAQTLTNMVEHELGLTTRWERPGTIQRTFTACVSPVDREEARMVGKAAVQAALADADKMVTLIRDDDSRYHCYTGLVPLSMVANQERLMPGEYLQPSRYDVTPAFIDYLSPLIGPPLPQWPLNLLAS